MKKKVLILVVILVAALLIFLYHPYKGAQANKITLTAQLEIYPVGTTAIIATWRNKTSSAIMYGDEFSIEKLKKNVWKRVKLDDTPVNFHSVGHDLLAYSKRAFTYDLSSFTKGLKSGSYRIVAGFHTVSQQNFYESAVYAYFSVK